MKTNQSKIERIIRVIGGIILLAFGIFGSVTGAWQVIILVIAGLLIITGATGFCPAYRLFNFSTKKS